MTQWRMDRFFQLAGVLTDRKKNCTDERTDGSFKDRQIALPTILALDLCRFHGAWPAIFFLIFRHGAL